MVLFKEIGNGVKTFFTSIGFLFKHNLWYYFLFPIVFGFLLFWGFDSVKVFLVDNITNWFLQLIGLDITSEVQAVDLGWWDWIVNIFKSGATDVVNSISRIMLTLFFGYMLYRTSKYVVLILLSPVMAFLSEAVEKRLTGNVYEFNLSQFIHDVLRGIAIAFRNMMLEFIIAIALFIVGFTIPILSPITLLVAYIFGWYFYGFAMIDYTNERQRLQIGESIKYVRKHKGMAIGNGFAFSFIFAIPLIGPIFAPIMAVTGATLSVNEITGLRKKL